MLDSSSPFLHYAGIPQPSNDNSHLGKLREIPDGFVDWYKDLRGITLGKVDAYLRQGNLNGAVDIFFEFHPPKNNLDIRA